MTGKKLFLYTLLYFIILSLLKIGFFNYQVFSNAGLQEIVFWALCMVLAAAVVRRFGIITYVEVIFFIVIGIVGGIFWDLLISSHFTTLSIFSRSEYWWSFVLTSIVAFLVHKKRHIQVRHDLHAKAHAAAHHKH